MSDKFPRRINKILLPKETVKLLVQNLPEFIAVDNGLKKMAKLEIPLLEINAGSLDFLDGKKMFFRILNIHSENCIIISKDSMMLDEFEAITRSKGNLDASGITSRYGRILGYPECCVENFSKNFRGFNPDIIRNMKNSSERCSFLLNNFFPMSLISHYPCNYFCSPSLSYAKNLLDLMKSENSLFLQYILWGLKLPMIVFDEKNLIFFEGELDGNLIGYSRVLSSEDLYKMFLDLINVPFEDISLEGLAGQGTALWNDRILVPELKKGNKLRLTGNTLEIYLDSMLVRKLYLKEIPVLLSFT